WAEAALPGRQGDRLRAGTARLPGARPRPGRLPRRLRRARLEAGRRLPDAEPDSPRPRVPDQGRARDRRRPPDPTVGRRHIVGLRPGPYAGRVLPRSARELLPAGPGRVVRLPGRDALRRAA